MGAFLRHDREEKNHVGVTTMQWLDKGHPHPLLRTSQTDVSQSELNPGPPALQANTLCKEPFRTSACTTTTPPKLWCKLFELEIVDEFDLDASIIDRICGGPNSERGSWLLEPLLFVREQGARTSECCVRIASCWGHQLQLNI